MIIFNPFQARVELARVFDTYKDPEHFEKFIDTFDIPEGYMVLAACMDECVKNLSEAGKQWFVKLGSKEILNLKYRGAFAFIGT